MSQSGERYICQSDALHHHSSVHRIFALSGQRFNRKHIGILRNVALKKFSLFIGIVVIKNFHAGDIDTSFLCGLTDRLRITDQKRLAVSAGNGLVDSLQHLWIVGFRERNDLWILFCLLINFLH